jgi:integrase
MAAAGRLGWHGHRDATLTLLAYRHGLRVSELVSRRSEQIDLKLGVLHVTRLKNGMASTHPGEAKNFAPCAASSKTTRPPLRPHHRTPWAADRLRGAEDRRPSRRGGAGSAVHWRTMLDRRCPLPDRALVSRASRAGRCGAGGVAVGGADRRPQGHPHIVRRHRIPNEAGK